MLCPNCRGNVCRRSRRRGLRDRLLSLAGLLPWRCGTCRARFYARGHVAVVYLNLVHCPTCGNLDLERVARDRVVGGVWNGWQRVLRVPAYRCDSCRTRFFSLRKFRPVATTTRPEDVASISFTAEPAKPAPAAASAAPLDDPK